MVWCTNTEPLEQAAGIERIFGGKCKCCSCGMCRICAGDRNVGLDLIAINPLRMYRITANVRVCTEDRCDGAELDDG